MKSSIKDTARINRLEQIDALKNHIDTLLSGYFVMDQEEREALDRAQDQLCALMERDDLLRSRYYRRYPQKRPAPVMFYPVKTPRFTISQEFDIPF